MADKIDQLKLKNAQGTDVLYDIDLPVDATPSIASLTTTGNVIVGGNLAKGNLTFTLPSSSGTLTLDENLPIVSFGTQTISGATEIKSISVGNDDYNLGGGGTGTVTSVGAGTGLSISGTATVNPTVNIASGYKLLSNTDWKNDSVYSVMNASSVAGSTTSGAVLSVRWYVSGVEGITTPYDGMKIAIKIPRAGVSTGGALLSINGNTNADYHPVAYNVNTVFTSHYAVNTIKYLTYDATATMTGYVSAGTATTITGVWKFDADYDSNTTITYGTLAYYYRPYMAAYLSPYQLVVVDKDNRLVPLSTTQFPAYSSSTTYGSGVYVYYSNVIYKSLQASNKNHTPNSSTAWWAAQTTPHTPTTAAFRPDKIYWYNTTTAISAGAAIGGNTLMSVGYNQPNMAICNFNSTINSYRMIYLRGTYNKTTGLFTLKSGGTAGTTNYYTLVPDNTANITLSSYFTSGDDYILIGASYSSNNYLHLREDHPMFHFDGTNLVPYDTYNENRIEGLIPTTYLKSASVSGDTLTLTKQDNTTVTFTPTFTDTNYYPSRSYSSGLQISTSSGVANTCALYVPYANSSSQSGVVSTTDQTFYGTKTFTTNGSTPVSIKSNGNASYIEFKNSSDTVLGYFGVISSKKPVFYDTSNHELAYKSDIGGIHEKVTLTLDDPYNFKEGSGKVVIASMQGVSSYWDFNLECNGDTVASNIMYAEIMVSDLDTIGLFWLDYSGNYSFEAISNSYDTLDTWQITTQVGYGFLSVDYIGEWQ